MTAALRPGLVGCGNMGASIGHRLATAHPLSVFDVDGDRAARVAADTGATVAPGLPELAAACDVVVLSLPTEAVSDRVVDVLLEHLASGSAIIETSTVGPGHIRAQGDRCAPRGVALVDAAILSGVAEMRAGTTTLLVGGADEAVRQVTPVLDALAARQLRLGPLGAGMAAKIGNNAVSHAVMVVLLEAAAMVQSAGVSTSAFAEMLMGEGSGLTRPLTHRLRERVLGGDYEGGMPTEAARKDSVLALRLAAAGQVPMFAIQAAHSVYEIAVAQGLGRDDYAAVAKLWEAWTGRRFD